MVSKPPGWKRPRGIGLEKEEQEAHAVGGLLEGLHEAEQERKKRRKPAVEHVDDFRDGHKVLRKPNGRFAQETAPKHKRPPRIPWDVEV